jgi:hypothetical protein
VHHSISQMKHQPDATLCRFYFCRVTLHVCLRPKHVEWPCRNKTCTVLHQVGVSFDLVEWHLFSCRSGDCYRHPNVYISLQRLLYLKLLLMSIQNTSRIMYNMWIQWLGTYIDYRNKQIIAIYLNFQHKHIFVTQVFQKRNQETPDFIARNNNAA